MPQHTNDASDESADDCILYELLIYSEWKQDPELVKLLKPSQEWRVNLTTPVTTLVQLLQYFRKKDAVSDELVRILNRQLPWQFAVGENGKVVGILQDTVVEIRTSRDEYSSIVGKAVVSRDTFPQWRKLAWSPDCSMLAISQSNGTVSFYDLLGSNIFNVFPPKFQHDVGTKHALSTIMFLQNRVKSPEWSSELVLLDYQGMLRSYLVSPTDGFQENHTFSFSSHYRQGVTAAAYHPAHNLLFVAGPVSIYPNDLQQGLGSSAGLSAWRLLNDHPYYRHVLSRDEEQAAWTVHHSLWHWLPAVGYAPNESFVFKMKVSPQGKLLACLHTCGTISVWHLPTIRLYKQWTLHEQPGFNSHSPQYLRRSKGRENKDIDFQPIDINWWSEQAVIIARQSGAISVCSVRNLRNLLGESPEFLAGQPQVSAMCSDRGFLGLECETVSTTKQRPLDDFPYTPDMEDSDDSDEESSFLNKSSALVQSVIYTVTDMERFQPKRKRARLLHKTYRLLGLKSTTPEELYARKIDNEEFGEALALAKAYNLDCDLVYQRQWKNNSVSIVTIHDYLGKIQKKSWVLKECVERVPPTFTAAQELLQFGLERTNLEVVAAVGKGAKEEGTLSEDDIDEDDDDDDKEKLQARKEKMLEEIIKKGLNEEQKELIRYRQQLLRYYDHLCTYELILGGPHHSDDEYDYVFYSSFRTAPVLSSTVEFAHQSNWQAVEKMFTYYGAVTLPHWLPVLSNFPETCSPFEYRSLLPECNTVGEVFLWEQRQLRRPDWCEAEPFMSIANKVEDFSLYEAEPQLQQFSCPPEDLTAEFLSRWYTHRVCQIEKQSYIVDHASCLLKLARERNIPGLDNLHVQLLILDTLVYEVAVDDISLSTLQKLSDLDKAKLLMSKTSESTFLDDLKHLLLPFLTRCEKQTPGSNQHLLREYLVDLSSHDLRLPARFFEHLRDDQLCPLVTCIEERILLVVDCVYAYPHTDQLDEAMRVLECVPERGFCYEADQALSLLHDKLDELECDLCAAEILKRNEIPKPLSFIRDCKANASTVQQLLIKLARSLIKRVPPASEAQWNKLQSDILQLQTKVFSCVSQVVCLEIFVAALLSSGVIANIRKASDILACRVSDCKKVSYERSVELVLQAAQEYFDSSGSLVDPSMDLAKACLHLITDDHAGVLEQLDLIAALQILNDFGVSMLPLQVRLCSDRMRLVELSIRSKATAYRSSQRLLQLAQKLRVCGSDSRARESKVLVLVAETSLQAGDYHFSAATCQRLIDHNHSVGWEVAQRLGQCQEFSDLRLRHQLLAFALLHCPGDTLELLVNTRCQLEAQMLHQKINNQVDVGSCGDHVATSPTFLAGITKTELLPLQNLVKVVEGSKETIKQTTYSLIKNVGNSSFLKSTIGLAMDPVEDQPLEEGSLFSQGCPTFYASLMRSCHISRLDTSYEKYSMPDIVSKELELYQMLLRISLLEQRPLEECSAVLLQLAQHTIVEDSTLGLAQLFAVHDPLQADTCLSSLPCTSLSLQLGMYYCALQAYRTLPDNHPSREVYLQPPLQLIKYVEKKAAKVEEAAPWLKLLKHQEGLLEDCLQGHHLMELGCGVDLQRFTHDTEYRHDTILGLAMTEDPEVFQLSLSLGARHNVPLLQIASGYICTLLLNLDDLEVLQRTLSEKWLLDLLHIDPQPVCEKLMQSVYPNISGTDHSRLIIFFNMLHLVSESFVPPPMSSQEHSKLLKKVKATSSDIDYKKLVDPSYNILELLKPVLTKENLGLIEKLLKTLPSSVNSGVHVGNLYSTWAAKEFFQVRKTDGQNAASRLPADVWMKQLKTCSVYFQKMTGNDMLNFIKEVCFVEQSLDLMTVECRQQILQQTIHICEGNVKTSNINAREEWIEACVTLERWLAHLRSIGAYPKNTTELKSSSEFQQLLRLLDLSRGEPVSVEQFFRTAVQSSISLNSLHELVSLLPSTAPSLEQLLAGLIDKIVDDSRTVAQPALLRYLPDVLRRMQEAVEEHGELQDYSVWEKLKHLCGDLKISPAVRLQILNLLQSAQNLKLAPEDNDSTMLLHHVQAMVGCAWGTDAMHVVESDLMTEEARGALLLRLLPQVRTWHQLVTVKQLLDKWPHFESLVVMEKPTHPHILLLQKVLDLEAECSNDAVELLKDIFKDQSFPVESLRKLVLDAEGSANIALLLLLCLLSAHSDLHSLAVSLIHKYHHSQGLEGELAPSLLSLILLRGLTPSLLDTPVYPQLVERLLTGDEEVTDTSVVVEQLKAAGCDAEAGSLQLLHSGAPPALMLFSAALLVTKH